MGGGGGQSRTAQTAFINESTEQSSCSQVTILAYYTLLSAKKTKEGVTTVYYDLERVL